MRAILLTSFPSVPMSFLHPTHPESPVRKYAMEALGTLFLVLTICLSVRSENPLAALAIGGILAVMVYAGGRISGGHYNPAVTLGVYFRGGMDFRHVIPYMLSQLVGAILGALLAYAIMGTPFAVLPATGASLLSVVIVELAFTFALAYTVLAVTEKMEGNGHYGYAIGAILMVGAIVAGPISGGSFNPAVSLGTILMDFANVGENIGQAFLYLLPQFVGGVLAAFTYRFVNGE